MRTIGGAARLGCIAIVAMVIAQIVVGIILVPVFWVLPAVSEVTSEQVNSWRSGTLGCVGCLVLNLTILWFLVGPVNVELRRSRKPAAPQGDTLTSLAMKGWRNRDESVEDTD